MKCEYRWTIEVFFRFFKHVLGCRHLLSHDPVGIQIQTYCAIIACMLINLWTGRKPTLRTYEMICHYFTGLACAPPRTMLDGPVRLRGWVCFQSLSTGGSDGWFFGFPESVGVAAADGAV